MTTKEFIKLDLALQNESDPGSKEKALLAKKKMNKYIVDCMSSTFKE